MGRVLERKEIELIAEKIKEKFKPEKIILFGSYAYGNPTKDSDVDFLVVTSEKIERKEKLKIQSELYLKFKIPVQIILLEKEEFLETKDVIGGICYPAAKYGKVLYEKP